MGVVRR